MPYRRFPEEPAAPLEYEQSAEPIRTVARASVIVVTLAGIALGFVLAASLRGSSDDQGTAPGDALPAIAAVPDTVPTTTTTTTTLPPTTEPATMTLGHRAPVFTGALWLVHPAPQLRAELRIWTTTSIGPEPFMTLPPGIHADSLAWDAGRGTLAALGIGGQGSALYAGPPRELTPIALNVASFAWHATTPRAIAWVEPIDDGNGRLHMFDLDDPFVAPVDVGPVQGRIVAWGAYGFTVLTHGGEIAALSPEGALLGSTPGEVLGPLNTSYQTFPQPEGVNPDIRLPVPIPDPTTGSMAAMDGVPLTATAVAVSPATREVAWVEQISARGGRLRIQSLDGGDDSLTIDIPPARILDWTPDGELLLLESLVARIDEDQVLRSLLIVDRETETVYSLPNDRLDLSSAALWAN